MKGGDVGGECGKQREAKREDEGNNNYFHLVAWPLCNIVTLREAVEEELWEEQADVRH